MVSILPFRTTHWYIEHWAYRRGSLHCDYHHGDISVSQVTAAHLGVRCSWMKIWGNQSRDQLKRFYSQEGHFRALSLWESKLDNIRKGNRFMTSRPLSNIVSELWHDIYATHYDSYSHRWTNMVVVDGLAPIWRHNICNHRDGVARSAYIRSAIPMFFFIIYLFIYFCVCV